MVYLCVSIIVFKYNPPSDHANNHASNNKKKKKIYSHRWS